MQRSQNVESEALAKVDGNIGAVKELRESGAYGDARGRRRAGVQAAPGGSALWRLRGTQCARTLSRAYFKSNVSQPSLRNTRPHS